MTNYLDTREEAFSDAEFAAIPRNADGDILDLYDAFPFITDAQREKLTGDDQSRMEDYDEEIRVMRAEFEA
jgi:hypothetical protein